MNECVPAYMSVLAQSCIDCPEERHGTLETGVEDSVRHHVGSGNYALCKSNKCFNS